MEFRNNEAIYLQIAAYVSEKILRGVWAQGEKIPSVRDLSVELQVNPNTVMRTYEFLQSQEVIFNKRGIGFFVETEGIKKVKLYRKERFLQQDLPDFFRNIFLLDITLDDLQARYEKFKTENFKTE
ncbi:DNA-binding transcriptional regulator YhcF (GntR family) [Mucilaginibacter gracilis]|uniref:DNA-binding transcriptional regulator YhcF (GntR family) n=1 Tax=Mucilaginibacter gracilis TaxID=423350 RepID=A0A495J3V5_9SPHI|nr:GntR family transcriptional regulator [Mucilaginibacter gracilis]RKR83637.1 DNA-binding transcriptional regulator YhcF (GntR family) [Mucilaginibacter gracilis]